MGTWRDVVQVFKMTNKVKRTVFGQKISNFLLVKNVGEKGEKKRAFKPSFDDPWNSFDRNSSGQELKFIALTRATRVYQKMRDFTKDPKE